MPRFREAETSATDETDVIQSLYHLVAQGQKESERALTELREEEADDLAIKADLKHRQEEQAKRSAMLERVQACLSQGPEEERFEQLRSMQAELDKRQTDLEEANKLMHEREQQLRLAAASLPAVAPQPEVNIVPGPGQPPLSPDVLAAIKSAIQSASPAPAAPAVPTDTPRFSEVAAPSTGIAVAAAAPAVVSDVKIDTEVPAPRNARQFLFSQCSAHTDCHSCTTDPLCGWCRSGACFAHNVNADPDAGDVDGLVSGQCSSEQWASVVTSRLTVLSLNVFGTDRDSSTHPRRAALVLELIASTKADIIAFQEAEEWFLTSLSSSPLIKNNYHWTDFQNGRAPGGLVILSKFPISKVRYLEALAPGQFSLDSRTRMLIAEIEVQGPTFSPLVVANVALDWHAGVDGDTNRAEGLDFIFASLDRDLRRDALVMGDFSFDVDKSPETAHIPINNGWVDVWSSVAPSKDEGRKTLGFTWDPVTNPLAKMADPNSTPSRVDRMLMRSGHWLARSVHLAGCSETDPLCTALPTSFNVSPVSTNGTIVHDIPSNHYAVFAEFSRFTPFCS